MYTKFTYWLDKPTFLDIQNMLSTQKIPLYETRKAVCLPLSKKIELGYVAPEAWSNFDTCRRQLSWYEASEFSGRYLLISETNINWYGLDINPSTIISKIDFKPPYLPESSNDKIRQLAERDSFQQVCPAAFKDIASMGEGMQSRWLKIMGIRGITYSDLFVFHCANHANFVEPDYFIDSEEGPIPYSIGKTKQVCSACLQFFNIIGGHFRKKYVVPCPGAVLFAGMNVNQHYQVETANLFQTA
ncbi:MAG: hypothetical protein WA151_14740 [Desulfatirhabdiaceae bacterium]